ncbi:UNVERIFIED_CONTAM: hypothetical protein Slati_1941500 [Sesamum latifolium]|uniref:CCHC-type domain-containing protein n=1 Tax=Sesamum latifolium TaxID=2727402 RepID=A0AAW2X7N2_9LAMI
MANLTKLDFIALDISGTNYLSWVLDAELHLAKENNQLLLNNHHTRPTGSKPLPENLAALPEANATSSRKRCGRYHGSPRGHSYGRGRGHSGRGRGSGNTWINPNIQKNNGNKANNQQEKTTNGDLCHRCGMSGHWSRTCRTTQYLVKLYQASVKAKARLEVPEVILTQSKASKSQIRRKRGRPLGSKDANPRKRKEHILSINHDTNVTTSNYYSKDKIPEAILSEDSKLNEQDLEDSYEMSINYAHNTLGWYRKEIEMNDIFAYFVAAEIIDEDENDHQTMEECRHRND